MPAIWNVNQSNMVSNKKVSSKLTFSVGEKFTGKIIKKEDKNVTIKLSDGWQFTAELDEEIDLDEKSLFKFVVKDLEDGKLKLKLVNTNSSLEEGKSKDALLEKFIKDEGLLKEDLALLKSMVKRNIPLTKENINKFKELLNFNNNIKNNPEEIGKFIEKYLSSNEINSMSEKGIKIDGLLKEFFTAFKSLSKEDLMLFIENDIDLNKENIQSFNKLFKSENGVKEFLKDVAVQVKAETEIIKEKPVEAELKINKEIENLEEAKEKPSKGKVPSYTVQEGKGSVVGLLKTMIGKNENEFTGTIKDVIISNSKDIETEEFNNLFKKFEDMSQGNFKKLLEENSKVLKENTTVEIKDTVKATTDAIEFFLKAKNGEVDLKEEMDKQKLKEVLKKENVESTLSKIIGKPIKLSETEYKKIVDIVTKFKEQPVIEEKQIKETKINEEVLNGLDGKSKEIVGELKAKTNIFKEIIKPALEFDGTIKGSEKILEFVKSNISDFKIFNSLSNEYYYVDVPINIENEEYPCKLIIKDDRKDGKQIDKNNVKVVVTLKTINLGTVDGYISLYNGSINVDLKCDKKSVRTIDSGIEALKNALGIIGFNIKINVSEKEDEVNIANCREFFSGKENRMIDRMV